MLLLMGARAGVVPAFTYIPDPSTGFLGTPFTFIPTVAEPPTSWEVETTASGLLLLTWSTYGDVLPPGLSLDTTTGIISGVPTEVGTFTFTIYGTNSAGTSTDEVTIIISAAQGGSGLSAFGTIAFGAGF